MRLPAEWEDQAFVQIAWPHQDTDWNPYLKSAEACYCNLAREISKRQPLVIVTPQPDHVRQLLLSTPGVAMSHILLLEVETNDTWARDHAFITTEEDDGSLVLNDFCFNGWGMKFAANLDNQINRNTFPSLSAKLASARYENCLGIVLEGGSIESDGDGTILTTSTCLMAPNRNNIEEKETYEAMFGEVFGAEQVLWLDHSWLAGDDTDGHIDTVARLCPNRTIAYVQCTDPQDEHYEELHQMELELKELRMPDGEPFRLIGLPMPDAIYEKDFDDAVAEEAEQRLPATYANFLILNGAVLMPTYGQPHNDEQARRQLQEAFPDREIVGVDCRVLIRQHGSLHCVTMQYPRSATEL